MIDKNQPFRFDVVWLGKTEFYIGINGQHTVDCAEVEPGLYGFFALARLPGILTSIANPVDRKPYQWLT